LGAWGADVGVVVLGTEVEDEGDSDKVAAERDIIWSGRDSRESKRLPSIVRLSATRDKSEFEGELTWPKRVMQNIRDISSYDVCSPGYRFRVYKGPSRRRLLTSPPSLAMLNFDLTDKTEESFSAAVQLAKDYANAQVQPVHIAFVFINEGSGDQPIPGGSSGTPLFTSVIQKAGGDPVSSSLMSMFSNV